METQIEFRGKKYQFIGDSSIICNCLNNGRKCNQRHMEVIEESPFVGSSDKEGYICTRMYKEIDPLTN